MTIGWTVSKQKLNAFRPGNKKLMPGITRKWAKEETVLLLLILFKKKLQLFVKYRCPVQPRKTSILNSNNLVIYMEFFALDIRHHIYMVYVVLLSAFRHDNHRYANNTG